MENKILVITEGEKDEIRVLGSRTHGLFSLIGAEYKVVPLGCSIYELYEEFTNDEYFDMIEYLIENKGLVIEKGALTKSAFSAVYLIFDLDPHYQKYTPEKIVDLLGFFDDETEHGKLYINYPMLESFYDFKSLPDDDFNDLKVSLEGLSGKSYKKTVALRSCIKKNKLSKKELSWIIRQQYEKAQLLTDAKETIIDYEQLLKNQLEDMAQNHTLSVLSTAALITVDYNYEETLKIIKEKTGN